MTLSINILLRLLPLGILLLIAIVYLSSNTSEHVDIEKSAMELQTIRHRRAIKSATIHYCKFNQYYDQDEGRCLGVPGGGKVLHVENRRSCGINVLKPHCKSSLYYHICKRDKSILAQCANRQIFDNRLQRCVYYDLNKLIPNIITPDTYMYYDHVKVPGCTRTGRFPVLGHCSMFYTCDTNGHRFYQSVFKCPQNTGYQVVNGICNIVPDCLNDNSVNTVCLPDAPGENVQSLNLNDATGRNVEETPELLEESKATADDVIVEKEKNINSMIYEDIITTTPESITDTLLENNYNDNDSNIDVSNKNINLSKSAKEILSSDGINKEIMNSQVPNLSETVQKVAEEQNEENGSSSLLGLRVTSPTTELDDAPHSITTSIEPEYHTNADVDSEITDAAPFSSGSYILSKLNQEIQDATTEQYKDIKDSTMMPSSFNTEAIDPASIISYAPEFATTSDVSFKINDKTHDITEQYRNNEDSKVMPSNSNIDSVDPYLAPTVSDVPEVSLISDVSSNIDENMQDATTEQYKKNEDSTAIPSNFNTDLVDPYSTPTVSDVSESFPISDVSPNIGEKMQDAATQQFRNNENNAPNLNLDSVDPYSVPTLSDVPESFPISNVSPNIEEKMQETTTEQYRDNEDITVIPSNFNTDSVDPNSQSVPTVSDVPEASPISDVSPNIDEKMQVATTEQYRDNKDITVIPSNFNTDLVDPNSQSVPTVSDIPEYFPISNVSPNIEKKMQEATTEQYRNNEDITVIPSNFNTDSVDPNLTPTVSDVSESFPVSDVSPNIHEKMQDAATQQFRSNEDNVPNFNLDSTDSYSVPTISDVPESFPISDIIPNIDKKIQAATTEHYINNEDNAPNFNTESINPYSRSNIAEFSPTSKTSKLDQEIQNVTPKMYEKDDKAVTLPNSSTEVIDPNLTSALKDMPAIEDNSRNEDLDLLSSSSTPAILPQTAVDQLTAERSLEPISSIDSKLADTNLFTSDGIESFTQYSPENIDDLYLTSTTSTLISKEISTPIEGDIATIIPSIQDPSTSDADLVT